MNIVMVVSVFGKNAIGGAELTAAVLAANLIKRGHQVSVVALGPIGSQIRNYLNNEQISVWHVPLVQFYDPYGLDGACGKKPQSAIKKALWHLWDIYNLSMGKGIRQVFQVIQPDIVMTHTLQGFSVAVWDEARRIGAKLVHMTHDHALICPSTAMTKGTKVCERVCTQCSLYSAFRHALAQTPDLVVGPSQIILDRHRHFGWFKNVSVTRAIPNALPDDWPVVTGLVKVHRPLIFGFLGRLDESKGLDTLLIALTYLVPGTFKIKIGGHGDANAARRRWLSTADLNASVEFTGRVEAAEFFQHIDVLVTPSRAHETFSNVVMEAACLGRPAIVSDSGALPERVRQGTCGWIFPAGDAIKLANTMQHCIDNPEDVIEKGASSLQTRPNYSAQTQCTKFESLFQELIA
jgi:glycosyltransferase involved in cell wall biosynthesis